MLRYPELPFLPGYILRDVITDATKLKFFYKENYLNHSQTKLASTYRNILKFEMVFPC